MKNSLFGSLGVSSASTLNGVWDAWKKIETSVDESLGIKPAEPAADAAKAQPETPAAAAPAVAAEVPAAAAVVTPAAVSPRTSVGATSAAPLPAAESPASVVVADQPAPAAEASNAVPPVAAAADAGLLLAREQQVMHLSSRNAQLEMEIEALRSAQAANSTDELRKEFSARIGQIETRLRSVTSERDALKRDAETRIDTATRELREALQVANSEAARAKAAEAAVRDEGLALASKIGKLEGLLKGVRAQLGDKTTALERETARAMEAETKLADTAAQLITAKADLQRFEGSAEGLKAVGARATTELNELRASELESRRKLLETQQQLESAWSDLALLRKESAQKITEAIENAQREAAEARDKWKRHAQQKEADWNDREKALKETLQSLRSEIARKEEAAEWRMHTLTERERELKSRLAQTEAMLAEERTGRAQAQAPLVEECRRLREARSEAEERINQLRNEMRVAVEALEKRLRDAQSQFDGVAAERDRAREELSASTQRAARLEAKCAEALASAEMERGKCDEQRDECEAQRVLARKHKEEMDQWKADYARWKDEALQLRVRVDAVARRASTATASAPELASPSTPSAFHVDVSVDGTPRPASASGRLEREVEMLQEELVRYARDAREAKQRLVGMDELERMLGDMGRRHAVALEMLGEKEAELSAMREDLDEVKRNFREQINALLK